MSKELVIDRSESQVDPRELAAHEPAPLSAGAPSVLSILDQAVRSGMSPETLEKLVSLHERMSATAAAREFNEAMAAFKAECPPVPRRTENGQFTVTRNGVKRPRMYASLEDIEATIQEPLGRHGLSYGWTDTKIDNGFLSVSCVVSHVGGHSKSSTVKYPVGGGPAASDQQKVRSTKTYAKRDSLEDVLGISTCDDDDGNDPKPVETITEHQAANLEALIDDVKQDRTKLLAWAGVEKIAEIPADKFKAVCNFLERKRGGK